MRAPLCEHSQPVPCVCAVHLQIFAVLPLRMLINIDSMPAEPSSFDRVYVLVVAFLGGTCSAAKMRDVVSVVPISSACCLCAPCAMSTSLREHQCSLQS